MAFRINVRLALDDYEDAELIRNLRKLTKAHKLSYFLSELLRKKSADISGYTKKQSSAEGINPQDIQDAAETAIANVLGKGIRDLRRGMSEVLYYLQKGEVADEYAEYANAIREKAENADKSDGADGAEAALAAGLLAQVSQRGK